MKAMLALADGTVFEGRAVGAEGESTGELVFNTSMTGYQEILTDPSYAGQIVTMTYVHIGNYGVNEEDLESRQPFVRGFVMRECCFEPSNYRATASLPEYLKRNNILAIDGVDTRKITKILRTKGAMNAIISTVDLDAESLVNKARNAPSMEGSDFVKEVSVDKPYHFPATTEQRYNVVALDFGIKQNILRLLAESGCDVTVMPATASAEQVLASHPDGVFLSNGPGDPAALDYIYPMVQGVFESGTPVFGICLGHQIIAHALGGETYKLKFGHRGGNQPVRNEIKGTVEITSQNHGFAVNPDSLDSTQVELTHRHLNDDTCSGLRHKTKPIFSVQYHPEASPGPHDSRYLFEQFTEMMDENRSGKFQTYRDSLQRLSDIAWREWDPIGVNDSDCPTDEYDHYMPQLYNLLTKGHSLEEIIAYLRECEIASMGLNDTLPAQERRRAFATHVKKISMEFGSPEAAVAK